MLFVGNVAIRVVLDSRSNLFEIVTLSPEKVNCTRNATNYETVGLNYVSQSKLTYRMYVVRSRDLEAGRKLARFS